MKLAIVGSRTFNDFDLMNEILWSMFRNEIMSEYTVNTIISGGADGADYIAKRWAMINSSEDIKYIEFPAEWDKHGKVAGFIRNQLIIDNCDMVLAFWDGKSKGTQDTIDKAKKAKKPTFIIYF